MFPGGSKYTQKGLKICRNYKLQSGCEKNFSTPTWAIIECIGEIVASLGLFDTFWPKICLKCTLKCE